MGAESRSIELGQLGFWQTQSQSVPRHSLAHWAPPQGPPGRPVAGSLLQPCPTQLLAATVASATASKMPKLGQPLLTHQVQLSRGLGCGVTVIWLSRPAGPSV